MDIEVSFGLIPSALIRVFLIHSTTQECPIATRTINDTLAPVRRDIQDSIGKYKKGVSLIFRDAIEPPPITADGSAERTPAADDKHVCVTDHRATMMERVGNMLFEYTASSFFQNNNTVLPPLTEYVRDAIFPSSESSSSVTTATTTKPTHLVDAYCGAGLFAITLSPYFSTIAGIELSAESIRSATRNAELNGIPKEKITFRAGDAKHIFDAVRDFPPAQTALVIDPPRKGSDEGFIDQLAAFMPQTVVYVSCNVHTQARDVGMILNKMEGTGKRYRLESLVGFDLFPQTAHVESVAVLRLEDA
jgi:tRNA (uracil-5-)-methyltransferase